MSRWLITFGVVVVFGSLLWPLLHQAGLGSLPGDLMVDFIPGVAFHLPITTSLLLSALIACAWSLLHR
jgi:Protein of unknown function (DUF2905)